MPFKNQTLENDPLLTPTQVANLLQVTCHTLSVWRCTARYALPFIKVGRCVRYQYSAVIQFLEQNTSQQKHYDTLK